MESRIVKNKKEGRENPPLLSFWNYCKDYKEESVRTLCREAQQQDDLLMSARAIDTMADYLASLEILNENSVLIPAPRHTGEADYTLSLCLKLSQRTGAFTWDALKCFPHRPCYQLRKEGLYPHVKVFRKNPDEEIPYGHCFLVDGLMRTGLTYLGATEAFPCPLYPLTYAVDYQNITPLSFQTVNRMWDWYRKERPL